MKFLRWLKRHWKGNGTKWLGFFAMIVAGLPPIDGLISPGHAKYWSAAGVILGALTVQRGMTNSKSTPAP